MNTTKLPEGYREILRVDLQKDKKKLVLVNVGALVISVVMFFAALPFVSLSSLFPIFYLEVEQINFMGVFIKLLVLLASFILYFVLHEAVHGIFMKSFSGINPRFGFTGLYAYTACEAFFDRKSYLIIGLSPVVIWGIVLLIFNLVFPQEWFWVIYLVQIINVSGAAGDIYVAYKILTLPPDILIWDNGVCMTVFSRN